MHLGANPDSVVPTGLDLGATLIPGLKPGAIIFRPCGTEFARGATACPRSDRMGSPVDGEHGIPDYPNDPTPNGVEQICIPCPKLRGSNPPPAAFGGHPRQRGTQDGARVYPGPERGHVPSAAPARLRVPVPTGGQPRGAAPTWGSGWAIPNAATLCPHSCSPEGATENSPGFQPGGCATPKAPSPIGTAESKMPPDR